MEMAFGEAGGVRMLRKGNEAASSSVLPTVFLKSSLSWLFAPQSKFCLSHRGAPAPLNCPFDTLEIQR